MWDDDTCSALQGFAHDDVNLLCLGAWPVGRKTFEEVLMNWMESRFSTDEDLRRRVRKLAADRPPANLIPDQVRSKTELPHSMTNIPFQR